MAENKGRAAFTPARPELNHNRQNKPWTGSRQPSFSTTPYLAYTGSNLAFLPDVDRDWHLSTCGGRLATIYVPSTGRAIYVHAGCNSRTCAISARKRRRRHWRKYRPVLITFNHPSFVVLTIRRVRLADLTDAVDALKRCFARLRRSKVWPIKAGFWSVEFTVDSESETAFPHLNIIGLKGGWIVKARLRKAWRRITRKEGLVANDLPYVNQIHTPKHRRNVFKYSIKPLRIRKRIRVQVDRAIRGKRLFGTFGPRSYFRLALRPKSRSAFFRQTPDVNDVIDSLFLPVNVPALEEDILNSRDDDKDETFWGPAELFGFE
ncbi:MAG: protein rep [Nitrospirae bacterium]|nr:protein rep [Nitrospirota bacterium]